MLSVWRVLGGVLVVLALSGLAGWPAAAGESWKPMGKDLRNMAAVAVNPRRLEEVYAGTEDGTIYRSTDGGNTWAAGR